MKILVLGANGMLGHRILLELLRDGKHEVIGAMRNAYYGGKILQSFLGYTLGEEYLDYDLEDFDPYGPDEHSVDCMEYVLWEHQPDIIINCVGVLKQNTLVSIKLNAELPWRLVDHEQLEHLSTKMVTFSTDAVFNGWQKDGDWYSIDAPPDANDIYGRTKALGEITDRDNVLTIRSSFIGYELGEPKSLLEWFIAQKGGSVEGRWDKWNGVTTGFVAKWLVEHIDDLPSGLKVLNSNPITKRDLLCKINEALNLDICVSRKEYKRFETPLNRVLGQTRMVESSPPYAKRTWDDENAKYDYLNLMDDIVDEYELYKGWRETCLAQ